MRIDNRKLDLILAQRCMNLCDIRTEVASQTLTHVRRGEDVLPATLGKIARALDVDPAELLEEE